MYPTLHELFQDLFGINFFPAIPMYGFMLAITFIVAAWLTTKELKRKEAEGLMQTTKQKFLKGEPATATSIIINGVIGFILGYKLLFGILDYQSCALNPQAFLLSFKGNIVGGILGAAISIFFHYREKQKNKLPKPVWEVETVYPHQHMANIVTIAAIMGIVGAKLFDVIENLDDLVKDPWGTLFSSSGLTFYGGLILASVTLVYYARKNKIGLLPLCDAAAPSLMLGYAIARIGCQVAGDGDWGLTNTAPMPEWLSFLPDWMWAYDYPHNVINEGIPIPGCEGQYCHVLESPAFPTPFYETVISSILFIFLWSIRKKFIIPGMLFCVYLICNGVERFFIEKIRVNDQYNFLGFELSQAQLIAIALMLLGVIGLWYLNRNKEKVLATYKNSAD